MEVVNADVSPQDHHHHHHADAVAPTPLALHENARKNSTDVKTETSNGHGQRRRENGAESEEVSSKGGSSTGEESTVMLSQGESRLDEPVMIIGNEKYGGGEGELVVLPEDSGRERLKRHKIEVAGRVWIPEIWGQEELLKDWIDCSAFDASLVPRGILSARSALMDEARRANSGGLRIENRC